MVNRRAGLAFGGITFALLLALSLLTPAGAAAGVKVSAGTYHSCAVKTNHKVACWGDDIYGQASPPGADFRSVSAGDRHTCGVATSGEVACWGDNTSGQTDVPPSLG